ncbi:uncharacterized protein LOC111402572 [Olea europaea var. sylvestris]|uniref:uncharacterized protein LOC111402572 n=1 Tax=Olea europaea var. sylvestris TaxID=158386 RepID=UPI000C1CE9E8|nr:uncharacterized protein LOC111402572 [Olea europaea var. sylvestris]
MANETETEDLANGEHKDYMCKNYIMNCLILDLYDVYYSCKSAKELWNSLEKKYATEDAGTKKFVVAKFLYFKMNDVRTVVSQVEELQIIIHEIIAERYKIYEGFQVSAIIEKLPPSWKEYKNSLKHKRKEMFLENMIIRIRIEEDNRMAERKERPDFDTKANLIEGSSRTKKPIGNFTRGQNFKGRNKGKQFVGKNNRSKPQFKNKIVGDYFVCGKPGHLAKDCRNRKGKAVKH